LTFGVEAQAPPPPPVPNPNATPLPSASPSAAPTPIPPPTNTPAPTPSPGKGKKKGQPAAAKPSSSAEPSATPTSPAFATLDGTWEVQLQYIDRTLYSYLDLRQSPAGGLSGRWRRQGKSYPLEGTYDGRLFKIVVKGPSGDITLSGFVEAASDMVGIVDEGKGGDPTPFTAEHRAAQPHGLIHRQEGPPPSPPGGAGFPH